MFFIWLRLGFPPRVSVFQFDPPVSRVLRLLVYNLSWEIPLLLLALSFLQSVRAGTFSKLLSFYAQKQ